jgi:hypothetical protein
MGGVAFGVLVGLCLAVGVFAAWRVVVDERWMQRPESPDEWVTRPVTFLAVAAQVAIVLGGIVAGLVLAVRALVGV